MTTVVVEITIIQAPRTSWLIPSWQPIETPVSRPLWEVFRSPGRAESPTTQSNSSSLLPIAEAAPSGVESALRLYHSIARLSTAARITWEARVLPLLAFRGIGIESRPRPSQ